MAQVYRDQVSALNSPTLSDGRYLYNGTVLSAPPAAGQKPPGRVNKKAVQRKHSTFNIVSGLFLVAALCLLYTGNVIAVNQLMKEVNDLTNKYNALVSDNEVIKAEIARKSSLDRISTMAKDDLGLTNPAEPPVWFEVDQDKIDELTKK
ncbi:MAG TPA: septum formation initiator family protein [Bacteroidota bacterium]|nr:septum formation initiator family protein [Bacteroidota bacterium]